MDAGSRTLKDAINEAMRDWVTNVADTYYLLGIGARAASVSADGPRVPVGHRPRSAGADPRAGRPAADRHRRLRRRRQQRHGDLRRVRRRPRRAPDRRRGRRRGASCRGRHAARFAGGSAGVLQGTRTFVLQDEDGNIELDAFDLGGPRLRGGRPGARVAARARARRVRARRATPRRSTAFQTLARLEGILPALESAHAVAHARSAWRRDLGPRRDRAGEPVGPRRQGRATVEKARMKNAMKDEERIDCSAGLRLPT